MEFNEAFAQIFTRKYFIFLGMMAVIGYLASPYLPWSKKEEVTPQSCISTATAFVIG